MAGLLQELTVPPSPPPHEHSWVIAMPITSESWVKDGITRTIVRRFVVMCTCGEMREVTNREEPS